MDFEELCDRILSTGTHPLEKLYWHVRVLFKSGSTLDRYTFSALDYFQITSDPRYMLVAIANDKFNTCLMVEL